MQLEPGFVVDVVPGEEFFNLLSGSILVVNLPAGELEPEALTEPSVALERHRELAHGHHAVVVGVDLLEHGAHGGVRLAEIFSLQSNVELRFPHRDVAEIG